MLTLVQKRRMINCPTTNNLLLSACLSPKKCWPFQRLRKDRRVYCRNPRPAGPHTAPTALGSHPPHTHVHACECVCIYVSASQNWKFERLFSVSEVLPWVCSVYWELWEMRGGTGVGNCSWRRGRGCSLNSQSSCFGLLCGPENAAIPELHHI